MAVQRKCWSVQTRARTDILLMQSWVCLLVDWKKVSYSNSAMDLASHPSHFMLLKPEISAGLMGLLARMQTLPYLINGNFTIFPLLRKYWSCIRSIIFWLFPSVQSRETFHWNCQKTKLSVFLWNLSFLNLSINSILKRVVNSTWNVGCWSMLVCKRAPLPSDFIDFAMLLPCRLLQETVSLLDVIWKNFSESSI